MTYFYYWFYLITIIAVLKMTHFYNWFCLITIIAVLMIRGFNLVLYHYKRGK